MFKTVRNILSMSSITFKVTVKSIKQAIGQDLTVAESAHLGFMNMAHGIREYYDAHPDIVLAAVTKTETQYKVFIKMGIKARTLLLKNDNLLEGLDSLLEGFEEQLALMTRARIIFSETKCSWTDALIQSLDPVQYSQRAVH